MGRMFRKAVYYVTSFPAVVTLPHCCVNKPTLRNWRQGRKTGQGSSIKFFWLQVMGLWAADTAGALPVSWRRKANGTPRLSSGVLLTQAAAWPGS